MRQYKVISASTPMDMKAKIEESFSYGWECQGGVSNSDTAYFQAMIRETPPKGRPRRKSEVDEIESTL